MEKSEDETTADDDPSSVVKQGLDQDDQHEGNVFLTGRDYRLQLRVGIQYGCPPTLRLKLIFKAKKFNLLFTL